MHVPCGRAQPGSGLTGPQRLYTLASAAQRVPAASLAILGGVAEIGGGKGGGTSAPGRSAPGMLGTVV